MKSNKELTEKEFEISQLLKRAMIPQNDPGAVRTYVKAAIRRLHS